MAELGHRIGPFELIDCLSSDQHTSLFKAVRPDSERAPHAAAIRVANTLDDPKALNLVELEYKILKAIQHPSIPSALSYYAGQGAITMSWVDGVSLHEVVNASRDGIVDLDPLNIWEIICETANVLRYVHSIQLGDRSLIHGRLSPRKIILLKDGTIKLLGLGKPPGLNLPYYSPPEQAMQAFIDWRSDQWALASIAIEMLLKENIYSGRQSPQQAAEQGEVQHWVKRVNYEWPDIGEILKKMLAPAAGNRFINQADWVRQMIAVKRKLPGYSAQKTIADAVYANRKENKSIQRDANQRRVYNQVSSDNLSTPSPIAPKQHKSQTHPSLIVELDTLDMEADLQSNSKEDSGSTYQETKDNIALSPNQKNMVYAAVVIYFLTAAYALISRLF